METKTKVLIGIGAVVAIGVGYYLFKDRAIAWVSPVAKTEKELETKYPGAPPGLIAMAAQLNMQIASGAYSPAEKAALQAQLDAIMLALNSGG